MLLDKAKILSLVVLVGMGGCTTNQYVTRSAGGYDDLYGGGSGQAVLRDRNYDQEVFTFKTIPTISSLMKIRREQPITMTNLTFRPVAFGDLFQVM